MEIISLPFLVDVLAIKAEAAPGPRTCGEPWQQYKPHPHPRLQEAALWSQPCQGLILLIELHLPHPMSTHDTELGNNALYWASPSREPLCCPIFATVTVHKTRVIDKRVRGRKIKWVTLSRHKLYWLKVCWLGSLGKYCFDWKWIIYVQFWTQNNF